MYKQFKQEHKEFSILVEPLSEAEIDSFFNKEIVVNILLNLEEIAQNDLAYYLNKKIIGEAFAKLARPNIKVIGNYNDNTVIVQVHTLLLPWEILK